MTLLIALGVVLVLILVGVYAKGQTWTHRFAIAVDILAASVIWSQYDVTISSRCGLALRKPNGNRSLRALGRALNWIQTDHCTLAIVSDKQRLLEAFYYLDNS